MADAIIQVSPDSTGKMVDNESLTVSANTVHRQRVQMAGAAAAEISRILNATPALTDYGMVTRPVYAPTTVSGSFTANAQTITLSPIGQSYGGLIVSGTWVGTFVCEFSMDPALAVWTQSRFYDPVNDLHRDTWNNLDGTAVQLGIYLPPGTRAFRLRTTAWTSGTATISLTGSETGDVRWDDTGATFPSDTADKYGYGPKTVSLTAVTDAAIVPAPGAGLSIYVYLIVISNTNATTSATVAIKQGTTQRLSVRAALDGGGAVVPYTKAWKLPANTALNGALSVVGNVDVTVHYRIAV